MKNKIIKLSVCMLLIGIYFNITLEMVSAEQDGDYTYTVYNGKATIIGYNGIEETITIPSTLGGYPTVYIGNNVFRGFKTLNSVTIPDSVTNIGDYAFYSSSLNTVNIPNSVITIGDYTFAYCEYIKSVTLPDSLTSIGDYAFFYSSSLSSIKFLGLIAPSSVGIDWIKNTNVNLTGHAYANSNFPNPGNVWNGLMMGSTLNGSGVVVNRPPIADFTWIPLNPKQNQTITFNASKSNDPDGFIIKYEWDWNNDGTYDDSQTKATTIYKWTQEGNYPVSLRVTDNNSKISSKTINILISSISENNNTNGNDNNKNSNETPGFEIFLVILASCMILVLKRKRKK